MRLLCCLDGANIEQISKAVSSLLNQNMTTVGLIYAIDSGPQHDIDMRRDRSFSPRLTGPLRREQMRQAEQYASQDIFEEGKRYFSQLEGIEVETLQREGRPEREIVNCAASWNADLIAICPRTPSHGGPPLGPKSVGHVARFVLDHAPCPVLLVRPVTRSDFPLAR